MAKSLCDEDQSRPEKAQEEIRCPHASRCVLQMWYSLAVRKTWHRTFAGFRAAKTVKQLTQEAMTFTGGEITVVNLVGEQSTAFSKTINKQFPVLSTCLLKDQESPQLERYPLKASHRRAHSQVPRKQENHCCKFCQPQGLTAAVACRYEMWWAADSPLWTSLC